MGVAKFERFFRTTAGLDVDKQDLNRFSDFVNHRVYDLLIRGVAAAKANGRDVIAPFDLPITRRLRPKEPAGRPRRCIPSSLGKQRHGATCESEGKLSLVDALRRSVQGERRQSRSRSGPRPARRAVRKRRRLRRAS
jgi:hypothetical protein